MSRVGERPEDRRPGAVAADHQADDQPALVGDHFDSTGVGVA